MTILEPRNHFEARESLTPSMDQIVFVNLVGKITEVWSGYITERSKCERERSQSLLAIDELETRCLPGNWMKWSANKWSKKMARIFVPIYQGQDVRIEVLPFFLGPRILPLKKRHEKLITGVKDFADGFDMGFHGAVASGSTKRAPIARGSDSIVGKKLYEFLGALTGNRGASCIHRAKS